MAVLRLDNQRGPFRDALLSAYRELTSFRTMLKFELDRELSELSTGSNMLEIVPAVISAAEAQGWTLQLLLGARASNPGNPELGDFAQSCGPVVLQACNLYIMLKAEIREANKFDALLRQAQASLQNAHRESSILLIQKPKTVLELIARASAEDWVVELIDAAKQFCPDKVESLDAIRTSIPPVNRTDGTDKWKDESTFASQAAVAKEQSGSLYEGSKRDPGVDQRKVMESFHRMLTKDAEHILAIQAKKGKTTAISRCQLLCEDNDKIFPPICVNFDLQDWNIDKSTYVDELLGKLRRQINDRQNFPNSYEILQSIDNIPDKLGNFSITEKEGRITPTQRNQRMANLVCEVIEKIGKQCKVVLFMDNYDYLLEHNQDTAQWLTSSFLSTIRHIKGVLVVITGTCGLEEGPKNWVEAKFITDEHLKLEQEDVQKLADQKHYDIIIPPSIAEEMIKDTGGDWGTVEAYLKWYHKGFKTQDMQGEVDDVAQQSVPRT